MSPARALGLVLTTGRLRARRVPKPPRQQVIQRVCDGAITVGRRVLVDQRSAHRGMAHPHHQLPSRGTRQSRQVIARMPQIVQVHPLRKPGSLSSASPRAGEVSTSRGRTLGADEHATRGTRLRVPIQMRTQLRNQTRRHGNRATPSRRLRSLHDQPTLNLSDRTAHTHYRRVEVNILPPKPRKFSEAQRAEHSQQHQDPVPTLDAVRQTQHLSQGEHWSLWRSLGPSAFQPAWVSQDQLIIHRCPHHRPQQPIRLRDSAGARA